MNTAIRAVSWNVRRACRSFGHLGVAGVVVVLIAAAAWPTFIVPLEERRDELEVELRALRERLRLARAAPVERPATRSEQLTAFYGTLPAADTLPDWLGRVSKAATESGVTLDKGEYSLVIDRNGRVARYQINLPLKAAYAPLRAFVTQVLHEVPTASLDDIAIKRESIGNDTIDARLRLTLFLSGAGS